LRSLETSAASTLACRSDLCCELEVDSQKFYGVKSTVLSTVDLAELSGALEGGFNLIFLVLISSAGGGKAAFHLLI